MQTVRAVPSEHIPVPDRRDPTRRSEGMPHDLANLMPAAVYTARTGADGAWLYASPQIEEILGHSAQEFLDDPGLWARLLHPDDRDWVLAAEDRAMVVTDERSYAEYRLLAKDGRVVWVLDDVTLQSDAGGSVQHGLLFDITQRKVAELLIEEQADVLERIAVGESLDETLRALAEALVRVTGATSSAVSLVRGRATYVAGSPVRDALHPGIRVPFRGNDGTVLGDLVVYGAAGDAPELDADDRCRSAGPSAWPPSPWTARGRRSVRRGRSRCSRPPSSPPPTGSSSWTARAGSSAPTRSSATCGRSLRR